MAVSTYISNIGIINAIGSGKSAIAKELLCQHTQPLTPYPYLFSQHTTFVGQVNADLVNIPKPLNQYHSLNNQFIATAYEQIRDDIEALKTTYGRSRIGIVLGTSTSGIANAEQAWHSYLSNHQFPEHFDYAQQDLNSGAEFLAKYADITGIRYTISTACSSSGKAIATAQRMIQAGLCDAVITGGSDSLCQMTLNGFDALELVSPDRCNPFSKNRSGLNIGEGAALLVLTRQAHSIKLTGCGESTDGYHISAPDPSGQGAKLAIAQALDATGKHADEIGYINLHGTATHKNDVMESAMIHDFFSSVPPCSSTKPLIGHTLGAASAHELSFCWLLLSDQYNRQRQLPKQIWDGEYDPELPAINLTEAHSFWDKPVFMSNSFAFGGSNVSLIIERDL